LKNRLFKISKANTKIIKVVLLLAFFCACKSSTYIATNTDYKTGVDFTQGMWLLNYIDSPTEQAEIVKQQTIPFFRDKIKERFFYRAELNSLLIPNQIALHPSKQKLKELKIGTGFDYFVHLSTKKNKEQIGTIGLFEDEYSTGSNQSEVTLEIYDLNLQEIIYSQRVIGTDSAKKEKSVWGTPPSSKLIDNVNFHKSANKLLLGCLKKVLNDLEKKSILN
jgi:hypothetical protein